MNFDKCNRIGQPTRHWVEEAIAILDELPECMKPPHVDTNANSAGATASYNIMIDQAFANHGDMREWYMLHEDSDRGQSLRDKVTIDHLLELARLAKEEIQKALTEAYEEKDRIEQERMEICVNKSSPSYAEVLKRWL